jgi:hypothetical protein
VRLACQKFCGIVFAMTNKSKILNYITVARKFTATNKTARQHNHTSKKNISKNCLPRNGEKMKKSKGLQCPSGAYYVLQCLTSSKYPHHKKTTREENNT